MKEFLYASHLGDLNTALLEAAEIKSNRYAYEHLGHHKTVMLVFFNTDPIPPRRNLEGSHFPKSNGMLRNHRDPPAMG